MSGRFRYFAYGSNMLTRRLRSPDRAPSAEPLGRGFVAGRRLTFDKAGRDGTGKCDAEATRLSSDRVYGVVFEVAESDRSALDAIEGLGDGYLAERVDVIMPDRRLEATMYVALRKDSGLLPCDWYKAMTIAGAREHGLPEAYVEWLESQAAIETGAADLLSVAGPARLRNRRGARRKSPPAGE